MGRPPQPEIAEALLDACTAYALEHGLPDRLRTLAEGTHTSSRVLVYHFGTREALLRLVLERARRGQRRLFEEALRPRADQSYPSTLRQAWRVMTGDEGRPYLRMFGLMREDLERDLWPGFRRAATTDWLEPLRAGLDTIGAGDRATLVLAVMRGLILDLEATDDRTRVDRAFADFVDQLADDSQSTGGV